MGISSAQSAWILAFQKSPILLTHGIAASLPGQILPIIALTEATNFLTGLLTGGPDIDLDNYFANFEPMPGSTLISNQIAMYPFANQAIAANAIIAQPLTVAMKMIVPAQANANNILTQLTATGGYPIKLAIMTALQKAFALHVGMGGTFSVITPGFIYTECILTTMRDVSVGESKQVQHTYQLDFVQPLVTLAAAQTAFNSLIQKLTSGLPISTPGQALPTGLPASIPSSLTAIFPPGSEGPGFLPFP